MSQISTIVQKISSVTDLRIRQILLVFLTRARCVSGIPGLLLALLVIRGWLEAVFCPSLVVYFRFAVVFWH